MSDRVFPKLKPVLESDLQKAQSHLDILTKPPGSLGKLEKLAQRYVAIRNGDSTLNKKSIFVFASDHGVTQEGVSAYPKEVTQQMVYNFLSDGAAINVLARHVQAEVIVVDMGVDHDFGNIEGIVSKKIGNGTQNMTKVPAMTRNQAIQSLQTGFDLALEWSSKGTDVFAAGEMGIGNSTSAAAIMATFDGGPIELATGSGTGVDKAGLKKKVEVIRKALQVNKPDSKDPLDVLSKIGGFEIGGMAGLILGAAECKKAIIVDGLISGAAATIALKIDPAVSDYVFTSHQSSEPGHALFFRLYNQSPLFDFQMRLGEGTGAALGISILESAVKIYNEMATFESAGISDKKTSKT
jgi:nicotinate-nucleotide--dimethylbenzimidazole phosphoribosyltransferase